LQNFYENLKQCTVQDSYEQDNNKKPNNDTKYNSRNETSNFGLLGKKKWT
jgi:hypothetical protein